MSYTTGVGASLARHILPACCALSYLVLPCLSVAADEIFRWTDKSGVTHFSDVRPLGVNAQAIPVPAVPGVPSAATDWRKLDEEFKVRHEARQKALDDEIRRGKLEAELRAIKEGRGTPLPGDTVAGEPALQKRVLWALVSADQAAAPECSDHSVTRTEAIDRDLDKPEISERWVLDRCGEQVPYRVSFSSVILAGTEQFVVGRPRRGPPWVHAMVDENATFTFQLDTN